MKNPLPTIVFLLLLSGSASLQAQQLTVIEGDFAPLKTEKTVGLEFTYDHMRVGKYEKEEDFINKKVTEMNKKEAGKGDGWATNWVSERKASYEPAFRSAFEKFSDKKVDSNSKYTLIFHTTFTEPGFNTGAILVHKNPEIKGEVWIVETGDRNKVIEKFKIDKAVGKEGYEFDTGKHLAASYSVAGKEIGTYLK